jgi:Major tropism determinant N-terminal domain
VSRLPTPGGDNGDWGQILNDYLAVEHNTDGTLKKAAEIATKYSKPISGIPAGDLSTPVQAALTKAESSVQSVNAIFPISGNVSLTPAAVGAVSPDQVNGSSNSIVSLKRDTATNWTTNNPVLGVGEPGYDSTNGVTKIGDGTTSWNELIEVSVPTRQALSVLSSPIGGTYSNAEMQFRVPAKLPQKSRRWRLHIRNYNILSDVAVLSGASFLPVYLGKQSLNASGEETGAFMATPVQVLPAFTLPSDGSEVTSSWVTDTAAQFDNEIPYLLDFGYTGGVTQQYGYGQMWFAAGSGRTAGVGTQNGYSGGLSSINSCVFDIRIEYEFSGDRQVIAVIGDSTASSNGNVTEKCSTTKFWPARYSYRTGHAVANGGIPSASFNSIWSIGSKWAYLRLKPSSVIYDAVIVDNGINDVNGGLGLASIKTVFTSSVTAAKSVLGAKRVFVCAIKPYDRYATAATGFASSYLTSSAAIGATTISSVTNWTSGAVIQIGDGYTAETVTVSGTPTGSGPYTVTLSTALTKNHESGEPLCGTREAIRRATNAYLSSLPAGVDGYFATDKAIHAIGDDTLWNPAYSSDGLHPSIFGHASIASVVPNIDRKYQ